MTNNTQGKESFNAALGLVISANCERLGLTQGQLAKRMGVLLEKPFHESRMSRVINGPTKTVIDLNEALALTEIFGFTSVTDLVTSVRTVEASGAAQRLLDARKAMKNSKAALRAASGQIKPPAAG